MLKRVAFWEKQFIVIYGNLLKLWVWASTQPADKKCERWVNYFTTVSFLLQFFIFPEFLFITTVWVFYLWRIATPFIPGKKTHIFSEF